MLYLWQGNLVCAPTTAILMQPCTTLLSGLLIPGVSSTGCYIHMFELSGRCITPVWPWLFVKQEEEACLGECTENRGAQVLVVINIPHWKHALPQPWALHGTRSVTVVDNSHSLGSFPGSHADFLHDFSCWVSAKFPKTVLRGFKNVQLDNSSRAKFKGQRAFPPPLVAETGVVPPLAQKSCFLLPKLALISLYHMT